MNAARILIPLTVLSLTVSSGIAAWAQGGAGSPGPSNAQTQSAPIPQKIILPGSKSATGVVKTDRARYALSQPVRLTFVLSNPTKKPIAYDFPTAQQFDFSVRNGAGKNIWQWSHGRVFAQTLTHLKLAPDSHRTYQAVWNGRDSQGHVVPPGTYTVQASMTSINRPAITGGVVVNTETDPQNMGVPTHSRAETGAVRQVEVNPPVTASKTITIGASSGK